MIRKIRADLGAAPDLVHRGHYGTWEAEASRDGKWLITGIELGAKSRPNMKANGEKKTS